MVIRSSPASPSPHHLRHRGAQRRPRRRDLRGAKVHGFRRGRRHHHGARRWSCWGLGKIGGISGGFSDFRVIYIVSIVILRICIWCDFYDMMYTKFFRWGDPIRDSYTDFTENYLSKYIMICTALEWNTWKLYVCCFQKRGFIMKHAGEDADRGIAPCHSDWWKKNMSALSCPNSGWSCHQSRPSVSAEKCAENRGKFLGRRTSG